MVHSWAVHDVDQLWSTPYDQADDRSWGRAGGAATLAFAAAGIAACGLAMTLPLASLEPLFLNVLMGIAGAMPAYRR